MRVGRSGVPSAAHNRANKVRFLAPQPSSLIHACVTQLAEYLASIQIVAGSIPVARSIFFGWVLLKGKGTVFGVLYGK